MQRLCLQVRGSTVKIRRPLVGVFRSSWEVYLPPTPLRWTPSPTLPSKTSGGIPRTPKPNHLPGRALPKPRTPKRSPQRVTLGSIWEICGWASGFEGWASRFGSWLRGFGSGLRSFWVGLRGFGQAQPFIRARGPTGLKPRSPAPKAWSPALKPWSPALKCSK